MTDPTPPVAPTTPPAGQYPPPAPGQYPPAPGQYPPAPGQPVPGQYPAGPPPYGQVPPPPKKSKAKRLLLTGGIVVVVLIVLGIVVSIFTKNDPDNANVGSCMTGQTADTLKITDCTNSNANWTVVGKVTTKSEPDSATAGKDCDPWPAAQADFYKGDSSGGYVLCLAPKS